MADAPPSSTDNNPSNHQATQVAEQTANDQRGTKMETAKEPSPPSVFVNSEPIREDHVQNAVNFLSHPKVRGSAVMHRRSFLERKGLTKEEIDEAFRRVPDQTPAATTTQATTTAQDGQPRPSSNVQQQPSTQMVQSAPVGPVSKMGTLSRFHWSHAVLAAGFLVVSGAGTAVFLKKSIVPKLKSWIRNIVLEEADGEGKTLVKKDGAAPSVTEEATAAAKACAAAAADVARVTHEMMMTQSEDKRYFEELVSMLNTQVLELKTMNATMQTMQGQMIPARIATDNRDYPRFSGTSSRQPYSNGKAETDYRSVRSLSPPVESSDPPHPKSYMEIMEMIKRGERPSNIREINDAPPNPNQPVSNPRLAPKPKPWEVSSQNSSYEYAENPMSGDEAAAWWQRRNVRISEMESGEAQKLGPSSSVVSNGRPIQRSWVPPQPPPVAMAEAVTAIRQPKKSTVQTEQLNDEQLLSRSAELNELQRITKISEAGGVVEATNGESSEINYAEMAKEESGAYVEA